MSKKILVVEDEKMLADMYKKKLEKSGLTVFSAYDAEEGLAIARREMPDLILLDVLLPRENGIELLAKVKKDPKTSSIPVLIFSNYDDLRAIREAEEMGVNEYLVKTNFTPQQIVDKIKEYLNNPP